MKGDIMKNKKGDILKKITYGIVLLMCVCPSVTGEAIPPSSNDEGDFRCLAYGYFQGANFNSYLTSDNYHLGSRLVIVTDCDSGVDVMIGNLTIAHITGLGSVYMESGIMTITLSYDNRTDIYSDITLISDMKFNDYLGAQQMYQMNGEGVYFSTDEFSSKLTSTVMISSVITWAFVTIFGWRFMAWYIARFHFSEVR